ncbi:polysaccharide deacetylase family protein [Chloroflexota bacterium]
MLLVITYHYIREIQTGKGIYPITPSNFAKQLDLLGEHFRFISLPELIDMKNNRPALTISENLCLITFDDGLREQYETAWPILKKKGIPAVFFVSTQPLLDGQLLRVHKIHYVRSIIKHSVIEDSLSAVFKTEYNEIMGNIDPGLIAKIYRYDSESEAYLKYLLNFVLSENDVDKFIEYLYEKYVKLKDDTRALYLTENQIIELSKHDAIGSHTVSHRPLGKLDLKEAVFELSESKKTLENLTDKRIMAVGYPYGGSAAVTREVAEIAEKSGYEVGFTTERSFNNSLLDPLLLARADTNDAIGGKSPQFDFVGGKLTITGNFNLTRSRWESEK